MMIKSLVIFLPSIIGGFLLLHLFWKSCDLSALGLKLSLGIGLGLGLTSCLYFLRMIVFPGQGGFLLIQVLFVSLVLIALSLPKRAAPNLSLPSFSISRLGFLLGLAAVLVAAITLYYMVAMARAAPHGDYDAQAIWNLRARFIYRSGNAWESAFAPQINRNFHMDYPLLIPLSVVGGWNTLGSEVLRVPSVISMLFLFGIAGIVFFLLSYTRSTSQAAIATIILLATPSLLLFTTFQTADIALTYFFVAAASLLVLAQRESDQRLMFIAGLMAGLSAWTKNEGLPFLVLMLMSTLILSGVRQARTSIIPLLTGMMLPIVTIILFKTLISVNNDLFTDNSLSEIIPKLFTPARYAQIFTFLVSELSHLGGWPVSILLVLAVYGWIVGINSVVPAERSLWILSFLQFLTYMLIYLITPHDLEWHMNYSMSRLLIHLFPMALCAFFLAVNTPESILNKVK